MKKFILILSGLVLSGICISQNINLNKGQKFWVDNKITALTTQMLMGQAMESNAELSSKYSIEVKDVKENAYTLTNTFTKMKMKMSAMGSDINFDSDKKEDMSGEYAASFKDLINKPKEVIISKTGKVLNTKKDSSSAQPDLMKMMIQQLIGDPEESGFGTNVALVAIPAKVSVGYSWADSTSDDGIQRTTSYTVKEIKGTDAIVTISGTLNTDAKSQLQGMDIVNKSKGNLTGQETVDITTGVIKQRTTTLNSSGTVLIESQNMEIPMTTKITFTSSVK